MWKDTFYLCTGRLSIVKMAIFPKMINRYNATSVKIPTFCRNERNWSQNSYGNTKDLVKKNLKREQSWRTHTFDFKIFYKAIVIKRVWYKDRNIDQGNRTESPRNKPIHLYVNWFLTGYQNYSLGEK